jgi:predicted MFS family arabinose efflux permease
MAIAGLPLLLGSSFAGLLLGLALIGVGTFFAQATATGFVGRAATSDRGAASGLYLASYFLGGLAGSAVLGQVFDRLGWTVCVIGIGLSLLLGALLAVRLVIADSHRADAASAFQLATARGESGVTH